MQVEAKWSASEMGSLCWKSFRSERTVYLASRWINVNRDFSFMHTVTDHSERIETDVKDDKSRRKSLYDVIYKCDISNNEEQNIRKKHQWSLSNYSYIVYRHRPKIFTTGDRAKVRKS